MISCCPAAAVTARSAASPDITLGSVTRTSLISLSPSSLGSSGRHGRGEGESVGPMFLHDVAQQGEWFQLFQCGGQRPGGGASFMGSASRGWRTKKSQVAARYSAW